MSGAPNCATSCCASRSTTRCAVCLACLDDLHQRRPAERVDAEKRAAKGRARLAFQLRHILVPEHESARHRPFAGLGGALEHERVGRIEPDGAQQFHVFGPRVFGSSHDGAASSGMSFLRSTSTLPMRRTSKIAVLVDIAAQAFVARQALHVFLRDRRKAVLLPGVAVHHQVPREAFDQRAGREVGEALLFQCRRQRIEARLGIAHRDRADHRAEHQPGRRLVLARALRPGDASAADQPAVDADRIRPVDLDRPFRRRIAQQRVDQRGHAEIERAPRGAQRLVRLQHHGELGEIEAAHIGQRSGALLGRDLDRMREGIAHLAQGHQRERRRQIEFCRERRAAFGLQGQIGSAYFFSGMIISSRRQGAKRRMAERPQILICSCEDTMPLDAESVRRGCRGIRSSTAHHLCRAEIERFRAAAAQGDPLIVGCTQEAPLFSEIAADLKEPAPLTFVNVRETAGWSVGCRRRPARRWPR